MPSSTRFSLRFSSLLLLAAATAVGGGACSLSFDASLSTAEKMGDGGGSGTGGATSDSNSAGAGPIDVPAPEGPGGQTSYMDLCGGGCMSGAGSIGCGGGINPDGNQTSCQIVPSASGASAECLPPGDAVLGEPCMAVSDCQPGLGCVRMPSGGGVCQPYCCADIESCEKGTYCTPMPMNEDLASPNPLKVPVCIPTTPCTLLDDTSCGSSGLTCTLVRADGSTSCVEPGEGLIGDPCPCAAGHVCSKTMQKCLKLCHVGAGDCPDGMLCQGGAKAIPDGIGVCVM
jgi:hypothetical protein